MKKLLSLMLVSLIMQTAFAQSEEKEAAPLADPSIQNIHLAMSLAAYGYDSYSATALLEAAKILMDNPTAPLVPESYEAGAGEKKEKQSGRPEITIAQLLADAREYAAGNEAALMLVEQVEKYYDGRGSTTTRGAVSGPYCQVEKVAAYASDRYKVSFRNGETAMVIVSGDGDTDLDLYIYDSSGNLITKDTDYTDDCVVSWTPRWTGSFTIKIVNRGGVYNRYMLYIN